MPLFGPDGKPLLLNYHREHSEQYKAIQASAVERWKVRHKKNPRYDFTRPSDTDIIRACEVTVENIDACYVTSPDRYVRVLPLEGTNPTRTVQVEEFVAQRLRDEGLNPDVSRGLMAAAGGRREGSLVPPG